MINIFLTRKREVELKSKILDLHTLKGNRMTNQLKEIQLIELELYKEFKRICDSYHLRYFAIGGTCIGAVRHKGFIPWDDDIDVAMPYQDYKKFQLIAQRELKKGTSLYLPENHKQYNEIFIKLQNDGTTFIELNQKGSPNDYTGVWIDIMPIFGLPKGRFAQWYTSLLCNTLRFFNAKHRMPLCMQNRIISKIGWFLDIPIRKLKPFNYYMELIEKIFGKYPFDNSDKVLFGWRKAPNRIDKNYTYQNVFYYDDFKEMLELTFEDTSIAVPCGYDRYLTMDFGSYMELPPEEKRVPCHDAIAINLDKSYKEYIKDGEEI